MFLLSLISIAIAQPSSGGIQVALYEPGADFASELIEAQSFDIEQEEVSSEAACYDAVGIRDLNAHVPLSDAVIELAQDALTIDLSFDQIHGEDMVIYGEDDDWLDVCPSFETNFNAFQIDNARVRLTLQPWVEDDAVHLQVIGTPIISGQITTDIDWLPDALLMDFVEDAIWGAVSDKLTEAIPDLVTEHLDTALYSGQVGDLSVDVTLAEAGVDPHALVIGMDLEAEWDGESCLVMNAPESPQGREPAIDFGTGNGSALGLGITERQLNGLLLGAYADGLLCFEYGPLAGALDAVGDAISDPVDNAEVEVTFGAPPVIQLDDDRMQLSLEDFHFALLGDVEDSPTEFISLDADIEAAVELRIDPALSSIVLDLVHVDLTVHQFQADALLSDQAGAQERLLSFLESWVMDVVADRVEEVPLYSSLLHAADIYIRLDQIAPESGALLITASLFDGDDNEVDTTAPDTQARIIDTSASTITLEWRGSDDKHDPLSFSWRIDQEQWSSWSTESTTQIDSPAQGAHIIEVRARDSWHNVDPSPALVSFEVPGPEQKEEGCMCSSSGPSGQLLGGLMLPLLWVRRRR